MPCSLTLESLHGPLTVAAVTHGRSVPQGTGTVRNPLEPSRRIRAVLFDVDGTLYRQRRLRLRMAAELASLAIRHPWRAPKVWRVLSTFRRAQEHVRRTGGGASQQLQWTARHARATQTEVAAIVDEWMQTRPLKYLVSCRATGLIDLLAFLEARRVPVGVLSDYPAAGKLDALGIAGRFSVVLSCGDPQVDAFKPSPRGFLAACARLAVDPADVLYVGDRADADAAGAAAAGMPAVIIGSAHRPGRRFMTLPTLERLRHVLDDDRR